MRDDGYERDDDKYFKRGPTLRYATALLCGALAPFVASLFATSYYAVVLVIAGIALLVTALAVVVFHELT